MITAMIEDRWYFVESVPRKSCPFKCGGKGYKGTDKNGIIIPCRCLGRVIEKKTRKEIQKSKRKRG